MSAVPREAASPPASPTEEPLAELLLDYPGADIILRSQDRHHFRVLKTFIVNNSPTIGEIIQRTLDSFGDANAESCLPVVQVPESGKILHCLLTFILPVTSILPSTPKDVMELLSVAQKYQMGTALTHIRGSIARHNSLPTCLEPALHIYALAQKYGLLPEALQAARTILNYPMTIEAFDNKVDIMSGTSLYELWKYHERVRAILASDLAEFRTSRARGTITGLVCTQLSSSQIPSWLDDYVESIGDTPSLFDPAELNIAMARHIEDEARDRINQGIIDNDCKCASIPSQTVRKFWKALASVVDGSFEKVSVVDLPSCLGCRTVS
jgi:BTB/POZ domain